MMHCSEFFYVLFLFLINIKTEFLSEKHTPSFKSLIALLDYFQCSADYLLGLTDIPSEGKLHPVMPFHERLRTVMTERNISQTKMVRTMPVPDVILYKRISGISLPNAENLIKIAKFLDCPVDYLIGRVR